MQRRLPGPLTSDGVEVEVIAGGALDRTPLGRELYGGSNASEMRAAIKLEGAYFGPRR